MLISTINDELNKKLREPFEQDSILNMISRSGTETFASSRYISRKSWRNEQKSIAYALKLSDSQNRLFVTYAFRLDVLDLDRKFRFYYDRHNKDSDLYKGSSPRIRDPENEDYVEPIPLSAKTETQLKDEFIVLIGQNGCWKNIMSRKFKQIGISVRMEEKSLNKSKRPYMCVVLVLSGKQNYLMKKKDRLEPLEAQEKRYE